MDFLTKRLHILLSFLLLIPSFLFATHNMGKDLEYKCLGVVGGNLQYQVTLRFYRNCWDDQSGSTATSAPTSYTLSVLNQCTNASSSYTLNIDNSGTCPNKSGCQVTALCPSQLNQSGCGWSQGGNPPFPGVEIYIYRATITLPAGCNSILLGVTDCCRNGTVTNLPSPNSLDQCIQAKVNTNIDPQTLLPYCNSSVSFTSLPVTFACANFPVSFNHGAVDADGDSLVYTQINPLQGGTLPYTNINYNAAWSVANPVRTTPPNSFGFNKQTGQFNFTPSTVEQDVIAIRVDEYRNGVLVGSTMRDIQLVIKTCQVAIPIQDTITSIQNGNSTGGYTVQACPGTQLEMKILCTDAPNNNKDITVTSNISSVPSAIPGAIFDTLHIGTAPWDSVYARIRWIPAISDSGCHYFNVTTKNTDCPINGSSTKVYQVCVLNKVTVSPHLAVYCGTPVQLKATGGSNFSWTPTAGLSATNTYTPLAAPAVDTKYIFSSDCGSDTALILSRPPFTMDAGIGGSICRNGQIELNASVDNTYAPYKIKWVPALGLVDPVFGLPNDSVFNPVASPPATQTYTVYFTASNGCVRTDTVTVNVAGLAPAIVAKSDVNYICPGNPVKLTIVENPSFCGVPLTLCNGNNVVATVTNNPTAQGGAGSVYPSPYGNFFKSARHQYLIKASELISLLGSGGQIKSVALKIATLNSTSTLQGFTIQMGCTSDDTIGSFNNNLITVFNPKNVTPQLGWNIHAFDQFYDWDGVSNLIVDICFSNPAGSAINNKMEINTTAYRSQWYSWSNAGSQCGNTGTQPSTPSFATFFQRPTLQFNVCVADLSNANINWTPNTGPNAPNPLNNDTTFAHPINTTKYIVNMTNPSGCVGSDFVTVFVDTSLKLDVTPDTFICSLAPIQLHANMTGSPIAGQQFTYTWTASVGAAPPSGMGAGFAHPTVNPTQPTLYKCVVTGGSCVKADSVNVVVGSGLPVSLKLDSITCFNAANGKVKVVLIGGVPPFTYNWSPNLSTTDSITNLSPNTYSVTVTDNKACSGSATITVTQPTALTLALDSVNIKCNAAGNGQVNATVTGGNIPYTYTWNPANVNAPSITGLAPGLYKLTVTDNHGCSISGQKNVTQPTALSTSIVSSNATSFGGSEGKAKVIATGGTAPYTYLWSDGTTKDSIVNKPKGKYYVTVCDANLCCKTDSVLITDPPPIVLTFTHSNNLCNGDSNAIATVSAVGGIQPYTFTWNNGVVNDTIVGLKAGTYTVTVADSVGVTISGNVTIAQPTPISITMDSVSILCHGGNNGSLQAIVSGGIPGYTYTWTGGSSANPKTGLTSGSYTVTVKDANNCTASASASLAQPDSLVATISSTVPTTCFGSSDGHATVQVAGGTPNYGYLWSTGSSTAATATDLPAGNWTVVVTDAHSCTTSANLTVSQPAQIQLTITPTSASCQTSNDGQALANVVGGTPNYTYKWDGTVGANSTTGLAAGSHSVTVTDVNSCSVSANYNVDTFYVLHAVATPTNASCATSNDGSAVVTANGTPGYTYTWDGTTGPSPQTGFSVGSHTVQVTDSKGCLTTTSFVVDTSYVLHAVATPTNASCATSGDGGASVTANGTPGYTYIWDGTAGPSPQTGFSAGSHSVQVTDSKGCLTTTTFVVDTNYVLHAVATPTNASCETSNDGSAVVTANGTPGYTYVWDGTAGPSPQTGFSAGSHSVQVTDSKGCLTTTTFVVDTNYVLHAVATPTNASCETSNDGSAVVTANGTPGYTYVWDGTAGPSPQTGLSTGSHSVQVTDSKGCLTTTTFVVDTNYVLHAVATPINASCATSGDGGASVSANGTPGYTYVWDGNAGASPISNLSAGTHTVIVTDAKNCVGTTSFVVDTNYVLHASLYATLTSCFGSADGVVSATPLNGMATYSYVWSTALGNSNTTTSASGLVTVTVTDAKSCVTTAAVQVNEPTPVVVSAGSVDPNCPGKSDGYAWASGSGGTGAYNYLWSTSSTQDSVFFISSGTYTVTITDANSCTGVGSVTLVNPVSVAVSVTQTDITCADANDGKSTVLASGGTQPYSYVWSDSFNGDVRNNIASGTYQITVADAKGCDTVLNLVYANPTPIEILLAKTDSISCPQYKDGKIYLEVQGGTPGVTQPYTYSIDGISFQGSSIFDSLANGTYTVYIKDANGCVKDTTLVVEAPQELVFLLEPMDSIGLGKSVTISPVISNYPSSQINGYSWSPSDGLSCSDCANPVASPYFETQYTLTIYYWENCVAKGTVTVKVGEEPDFYIPNAFSPNGDGKNDLLEVYGSGLKTVGLTIFNRWGEKVFDSDNQWVAWDGTYKGVLLNPGLYTYNAELEYLNGRKKHKFGSITLIR